MNCRMVSGHTFSFFFASSSSKESGGQTATILSICQNINIVKKILEFPLFFLFSMRLLRHVISTFLTNTSVFSNTMSSKTLFPVTFWWGGNSSLASKLKRTLLSAPLRPLNILVWLPWSLCPPLTGMPGSSSFHCISSGGICNQCGINILKIRISSFLTNGHM